MKTNTRLLLSTMHIITWIVFIGLYIKAGAIIISFIVSLAVNPEGAENLYINLDLSMLLSFNIWHYTLLVLCIILISAFKAYLFYVLIRIFKKINLIHPFSKEVSFLIRRMSIVALIIALFSIVGYNYSFWITENVVTIFNAPSFFNNGVKSLFDLFSGHSEFLFLAGIIFVTSLIFKRGIEYQDELDETV